MNGFWVTTLAIDARQGESTILDFLIGIRAKKIAKSKQLLLKSNSNLAFSSKIRPIFNCKIIKITI